MQFTGDFFPSIATPDEVTLSQRSYCYDPLGSLSKQSSSSPQSVGPAADNNTYLTPQRAWAPGSQYGDPNVPQVRNGFIGNIELTKPVWFSMPGWYGESGVGGINNNWDDLRQEGVGYGLYAPHLPQHPVPAVKLYEPGSGFVLPATFLGQPLIVMASPPGS